MKNALVLSQSEAHNFFMYIIKIITITTIDIINISIQDWNGGQLSFDQFCTIY